MKPYIEFSPIATVNRLRVEVARSQTSIDMLKFGLQNDAEVRRLATNVSGIDIPSTAVYNVSYQTILEPPRTIHVAMATFYWET